MRNLNFVVFYSMVFVIFGLVIGAFYGEEVETMNVDELRSMNDEEIDQAPWYSSVDAFFGAASDVFGGFIDWLSFLWRAISLDIPGLPWYLRALIVTPLHIGMGYLILTHIPMVGGSGS